MRDIHCEGLSCARNKKKKREGNWYFEDVSGGYVVSL